MKFSDYLVYEGSFNPGSDDEPRTKSITVEDARRLLNGKCSKAFKDFNSGRRMYRELSRVYTDPYRFTEGEKSTSAHADDVYTLIMENAPEWKKFPKRDVICTTDIVSTLARAPKSSFCVFPFNGFKIGICPESDISSSFKIDGDKFNDDIIKILQMALITGVISKNEYPSSFSNWKALQKVLKKIDGKDLQQMDIPIDFFLHLSSSKISLYEAALDIINPKSFTLTKNNIPNVKNREVWTDSPCLLIKLDTTGEAP